MKTVSEGLTRLFTAVLQQAEDDSHRLKAFLMGDFHPDAEVEEIPDPYYGRAGGFELVLDLLEVACRNLLQRIVREHRLGSAGS